MLRAVSLWDVIYEHVGYWTAPAMETAFRRTGFAPVSVPVTCDGLFLALEGRPAVPDPSRRAPDVGAVAADALALATAANALLDGWREWLAGLEGHAVI